METIQVIASAAERFFWDYWPQIAAAAALVLVLVLAAWLWMKRKKRKQAEAEEEAPEAEEPKKQVIEASSLADIWKAFLREIPPDLRSAVMVYDHFVVFGGAGSGKSALIDNCTDWTGYARQFYPSYTANPLLQIYLGSRVMVQEIPASLLSDVSEDVRKALLKLWKKAFFRGADPTVVVVLNGSPFPDEQEYAEYLTREAQFIRGKINLLSRVIRKPVKVRIAVTHLDMIEGFDEFSSVAIENNFPLKLDFSENAELGEMAKQFDSFEELLPSALTSLPADGYLRAMAFVSRTKKLLDSLTAFANVLLEHDPLSREPLVESIYLTSLSEEKSRYSNPFTPAVTAEELEKYDPYARHRLAAVVLCSAAVLYLLGSFAYEWKLLSDRKYQVSIMETLTAKEYDRKIHGLFPDVYLRDTLLKKLMPTFFGLKHEEVTRQCIEGIRKYFIYPRLESYSSVRDTTDAMGRLIKDMAGSPGQHRLVESSQDKLLYAVALLYAADGNELGRLVEKDFARFSESLGLPELLVRDYVKYNQPAWPVSYDVKKLSFAQPRSQAEQVQQMMAYQGKMLFSYLSSVADQNTITQSEYEKIEHETDHYLMIMQQYDLQNRYVDIVRLLKKETPLTISADSFAPADPRMDLESIRNFLLFVKGLSLKPPQSAEGLRFNSLAENIRAMLNYNQLASDRTFKVSLAGQDFTFSAQQWTDLFNRSRITVFLHNFVNYYRVPNGMLFFFADNEFPDIVMNETNDGGFLFTGKARIDGRFTKDAVEKRVKPVLTDLPALINSLAIPQGEKNYFLAFFRREVDYYGQLYAGAYRKYYVQFDIKINSMGALRFTLNQMFLPSSGFMTFLQSISSNTQIDPGNNDYLPLIASKLREFDFTRRLMDDKKGTTPELDKYRALLDQMQSDIQQDPPAKKGRDDAKNGLKSQLTPLGKVALAINRGEPDSYLNLTRDWMDSVGIPKQWRDLFLAPVWTTHYLGMKEVEAQIGGMWTEIFDSNVRPLYRKFPFNALSDEDATADEVINAAHPNGRFWQSFKKAFGDYCAEEGGAWVCRPGPYGFPKLPANMAAVANSVANISKLLWDRDGKERSIQFSVNVKPLPPMLPQEPVVTLSYFTAGQSSILNFNQQVSRGTLKHEWQNPCRASVGLEFLVPGDKTKYKSSIEVSHTDWCFYKLLKRTEEFKAAGRPPAAGNGKPAPGPVEQKWVIDPSSSRVKSRPIELKLQFKSDPWKMIRLP